MAQHNILQNTWKQQAANAAVERVQNGMVIGIGTGSTANFMIRALGQRIQQGLRILGAVPSSQESKDLAESLGIPIINLDNFPTLDLYIDGADEIDDQLNLLKGAGGALLREKIVATAARNFIVIADVTKRVSHLVQHFPVPVEVIPLAATPIRTRLEALGASTQIRHHAGNVFFTENCNIILDCTFPHGITNLYELQQRIKNIIGVVETGLFLDMAHEAFIAGPEGIQTLSR